MPVGSYFNVLSFGSNFKYMFDRSKEYSEKNLKSALEEISKFGGDMGGTDLLRPL